MQRLLGLFLVASLSLPLPMPAQEARQNALIYREHRERVAVLIEVNEPHELNRYIPPAPRRRIRRSTATVEQWRPLVAQYFPAKAVNAALRVMACESGGNPTAQNTRSSAGGLFQFLDGSWKRWGNGPKYDPEANIQAAAAYYRHAGWAPWSCKP
jgi:soluble lytic murein transglycosylase-like protein